MIVKKLLQCNCDVSSVNKVSLCEQLIFLVVLEWMIFYVSILYRKEILHFTLHVDMEQKNVFYYFLKPADVTRFPQQSKTRHSTLLIA